VDEWAFVGCYGWVGWASAVGPVRKRKEGGKLGWLGHIVSWVRNTLGHAESQSKPFEFSLYFLEFKQKMILKTF
jgi:hypothetical protein